MKFALNGLVPVWIRMCSFENMSSKMQRKVQRNSRKPHFRVDEQLLKHWSTHIHFLRIWHRYDSSKKVQIISKKRNSQGCLINQISEYSKADNFFNKSSKINKEILYFDALILYLFAIATISSSKRPPVTALMGTCFNLSEECKWFKYGMIISCWDELWSIWQVFS